MTLRVNRLNLLAFGNMRQKGENPPILRMKKPANAITLLAFFLVAGIGIGFMIFRFAT
jgi:hypothetical protein